MYPILRKKPTQRQKAVLDFLSDFIKERGYPPALREICSHLNIKGPNNAAKHLEALRKKGLIRRSGHISRGIEVIEPVVKDVLSLPVAGRVRAGLPHLAVEDITAYVVVDPALAKRRDFILKAEGDSMTGAGIDHGDYLVIRPGVDIAENDIAVFMVGDETTVKRFSRSDRGILLKPENPAYQAVRITGAEDFSVVGKVVLVMKRLEK